MKFIFEVAPKGTCWWINPRQRNDSPNQRQDMLFTLNRVYIRDGEYKGKYLYQLVIGRLQVLVAI